MAKNDINDSVASAVLEFITRLLSEDSDEADNTPVYTVRNLKGDDEDFTFSDKHLDKLSEHGVLKWGERYIIQEESGNRKETSKKEQENFWLARERKKRQQAADDLVSDILTDLADSGVDTTEDGIHRGTYGGKPLNKQFSKTVPVKDLTGR